LAGSGSDLLSFTTLAGNAGYGSVDGLAATARFYSPQGVAVDGAGNVYVADTYNHTIRKIAPDGVTSTLAGAPGQPGAKDGVGPDARFAAPAGLVSDLAGDLYVADSGNSTIRRIAPDGTVTTLIGSPGVSGSTDGTNHSATFRLPTAISVDSTGVLYVADTYNHTVRKVFPAGTNWVVKTLAGSPAVPGNADGANTNALFNTPSGITVAPDGNIYIADTGNDAVRKLTSSGSDWVTTTVAYLTQPTGIAAGGTSLLYLANSSYNVICTIAPTSTNSAVTVLAGTFGVAGSADGTNFARFNFPNGLARSTNGVLYVADSLNNTIRRVTPAGVVSTFAGLAGGPGASDGTEYEARFNAPLGLALDAGRNLFVADTLSHSIRRVTPDGMVTTLAGSRFGVPGSSDGVGTNAGFNLPAAVVLDQFTNVYVADSANNEIRKLTLNDGLWSVTTLAGRPGPVFLGTITNFAGLITNLVAGTTDISFASSSTALYFNYSGLITNVVGNTTNIATVITNTPQLVQVVGGQTNLVTLSTNVFQLTPFQVSTVFSSTATYKNYSGLVTNVSGSTSNVAVLITNTPLFSSIINGKTNQFSPATILFTLPPAPTLLDGIGANALFHNPSGLALGAGGNLYVADGDTNGVRLVSPQGVVTTLTAAQGAYSVPAGQFGTGTLPYHSSALAVDSGGNLYVADNVNFTIRRISPDDTVTTLAGAPGLSGQVDGTNGAARFSSPVALCVDAQTNLFVADAGGHTIRQLAQVGNDWVVTTVGGQPNVSGSADGVGGAAQFNRPGGIAIDDLGTLYIADTDNNSIRLGQPFATNAPVTLQFQSSGSQLLLSWPTTATGYRLETTSSLSPGNQWLAVTNSPVVVGPTFVMTNDLRGAAAFFRLSHP
jgi:sugar lactone lactonase YvrE